MTEAEDRNHGIEYFKYAHKKIRSRGSQLNVQILGEDPDSEERNDRGKTGAWAMGKRHPLCEGGYADLRILQLT